MKNNGDLCLLITSQSDLVMTSSPTQPSMLLPYPTPLADYRYISLCKQGSEQQQQQAAN